MSTVSTSPRATEDSVTPRRHSLTEGQKPGWTWMAVAAAAAVVAAGLTVLLNVLGDNGPVIVRWQRSRVPFMTTLAVGATLPLTQSATGRVLLAFLPAKPATHLIETEHTPAADLAARLALIRSRGYDTADSTVIPGLAAISAPILDVQDEAVAALTLVGAGPDVRPLEQKAVDALLATCRHVSDQCGSTFLAALPH